MSEGWAGQLAPENIGVSVLCPGFVKTRIFESGRARQDKYGPASDERDPDRADAAKQLVLGGIDPDRVGERVLEAVEAGELYIFTHPDMAPLFADRARRIEEAFARAAESRALQGLDYRTPGKINVLD